MCFSILLTAVLYDCSAVGIGNCKPPSATDMQYMFSRIGPNFNADLSKWDTPRVRKIKLKMRFFA